MTEHCAIWGVDARSPYVLEATRQVLRRCREHMGQSGPLSQFLLSALLAWNGWPWEDFRAEVGATILLPASASIRESLLTFVLREPRLGDPRLEPHVQNWQEMPEDARRRMTQWLSEADLALFFDLLAPRRAARL